VRGRVRAPAALLACAGLLAFAGVGACSLAINLDALSSGVCPAGQKACDNECVAESDPNFGCAAIGCAPCTLLNAVSICTPSGACALGACVGNFRNCSNNPTTGCETDIDHDPTHCGDCSAAPCTTKNGTPGCSAGHCTTGACDTDWGDCNQNPTDGCEANLLTDPKNCGQCKSPCASTQTCQAGKCM
jgi:hypothetical protein